MLKKPKQAECPGCKKRTLEIEFCREEFVSYQLLESGYEGAERGTCGQESSISCVRCPSCGWEDYDDPEGFASTLRGEHE